MSLLSTVTIPLALLVLCANPAFCNEKTTQNEGTIIAVGDSLTAGFGVDFNKTYPAQLQNRLNEKGYNFTVINSGVSGETSSGTLSRIDWVLEMNPDIVILETGANDGLRGISTEIPRKNISKLIDIFQEKGVIVILAGMQMVWNMGEDYTNSFNELYPELAEKNELIYMPFFLEDVATRQKLNQEDGIHPTGEGYEIITNNLLPYVEQAIKRFKNSTN